MERLTARRADTLRKPGRYRAGDTVYLVVARGRTGRVNKRWVQRLHVQGKRRDIGIGTYPAVTLSEARERAHDNRLTAKRGGDPSGRASTVPTFAAVSAKVERGGQWRGQTRETRRRTLARYAARLMDRSVDQIDRAAVLSVLGPVYRDKPATGKLLRGWVRGVRAAAQALGHVDVNAAGEVIDAALPKSPKARAHRRALPYADVPAALVAVEITPAYERLQRAVAVRAGRIGDYVALRDRAVALHPDPDIGRAVHGDFMMCPVGRTGHDVAELCRAAHEETVIELGIVVKGGTHERAVAPVDSPLQPRDGVRDFLPGNHVLKHGRHIEIAHPNPP